METSAAKKIISDAQKKATEIVEEAKSRAAAITGGAKDSAHALLAKAKKIEEDTDKQAHWVFSPELSVQILDACELRDAWQLTSSCQALHDIGVNWIQLDRMRRALLRMAQKTMRRRRKGWLGYDAVSGEKKEKKKEVPPKGLRSLRIIAAQEAKRRFLTLQEEEKEKSPLKTLTEITCLATVASTMNYSYSLYADRGYDGRPPWTHGIGQLCYGLRLGYKTATQLYDGHIQVVCQVMARHFNGFTHADYSKNSSIFEKQCIHFTGYSDDAGPEVVVTIHL